MRKKDVAFSEVYDVRALRVIVDEVKDCYTALGIVHHIWSPIAKEFDDYIAHPKGNDYRSLHTAVHCPDGRSLEVQIRTRRDAQPRRTGGCRALALQGGQRATPEDRYDEKIAWLRQLLTWRDEVADSSDWVRHYKQAAFDETVYILTPQGRVVDLPRGATPVDFAYRVHTDLGHRCRGAKVDGALVPLNTPAGHRPACRDHSCQARWAVARLAQPLAGLSVYPSFAAQGQAMVRQPGARGHPRRRACGRRPRIAADGAARHQPRRACGPAGLCPQRRPVHCRCAGQAEHAPVAGGGARQRDCRSTISVLAELPVRRQRDSDVAEKGILIVGVDRLLTQLAGCCKPAPPDPIVGFVTRGKGVSVHRADCSNFSNMRRCIPSGSSKRPGAAAPTASLRSIS
jgi:GTP pyrophosphokinase